MQLVGLLFLVAVGGCNKDDEVTYSQFNAVDEFLEIEVGQKTVEPERALVLHSSTGEVTVGSATVDPGGGPIGTEHEIVVIVEDAYENTVDRVTVRTDSGDRGEDEYDLEPDSADEGFYKTTLVSVGEPGEVRTDRLTFILWDEDDDEDSAGRDTGEKKADDSSPPDDSAAGTN
jgi:hypothetical protein